MNKKLVIAAALIFGAAGLILANTVKAQNATGNSVTNSDNSAVNSDNSATNTDNSATNTDNSAINAENAAK